MDARHHGADRDRERRGDLGVAEVLRRRAGRPPPGRPRAAPASARSRSSWPEASASWGGGDAGPSPEQLDGLGTALRRAGRRRCARAAGSCAARRGRSTPAGSGRRPGARAGRSPAPGPRRRGRSPSFGTRPRRGTAGGEGSPPRIALHGSNRAVPGRPSSVGRTPPGSWLFRMVADSDTGDRPGMDRPLGAFIGPGRAGRRPAGGLRWRAGLQWRSWRHSRRRAVEAGRHRPRRRHPRRRPRPTPAASAHRPALDGVRRGERLHDDGPGRDRARGDGPPARAARGLPDQPVGGPRRAPVPGDPLHGRRPEPGRDQGLRRRAAVRAPGRRRGLPLRRHLVPGA